jgi:putative endonuclease
MAKKSDEYSVYIVRCSDNTLYTGISKDVANRIDTHNKGRGARYTKSRSPVQLVFQETGFSHSDALKRERKIKKFPRAKKEGMIREYSA